MSSSEQVAAARAARDAENADPATFADPTLDCDIVMKGGITSGVVYPGAVLRLARRYRFRSIGGTSAGAIAASIVAAAEHARDAGGFREVAKLPRELAGRTESGEPFMFQLFQADAPTRPLFRAITGYLLHGRLGGTVRAAGAFWKAPAAAAVVALAAVALAIATGAGVAVAVAGVLAAVIVLGVGIAVDLARSVQRIAGNDFGICRLGPEAGTDARPALTTWLHRKIQTVGDARNGPPLTFADLWGVPAPATEDPRDDETRHAELLRRSRTPDARAVDLQMVTTDLTHGRPIRLPVPYQRQSDRLEEEAGRLLFEPRELARFFPPEVVAHLVRFAEPLGATAETVARLGAGRELHRFPIGPDLPVVVAARMSLSFPFLIAAVPLWRLEFQPGRPVRLQRVIFSDGGVTSNFPIHFFDSPLPTRPTFGLHLTEFAPYETPDLEDPRQAVDAPRPPAEPARDPALEIDGLAAFAGALKNAGQNWRDNAQARLPGFRDRVAHIKLAADEGGLNLAMSEETILRMNDRGDRAGEVLAELFAGPGASAPTEHWNDHRFTRYRTTMSLAERWMRGFHHGYTTPPTDPVTTPYRERVANGLAKPYTFGTAERRDAALATGETYVDLVEAWGEDPVLDDKGVPRPPSVLRAVPPV